MNLITHNTLHYVNSNAQLWLLIIYFVLRINYSSNRYSIAIKLYVLIIYKLVMYELEECTMLNTSIGYHTFALSYKLIDSKHLKSIHKHFLRYQKINRHSPYLSITLHKWYPYYLFGISTFPNSVYHTISRRKFSITIV